MTVSLPWKVVSLAAPARRAWQADPGQTRRDVDRMHWLIRERPCSGNTPVEARDCRGPAGEASASVGALRTKLPVLHRTSPASCWDQGLWGSRVFPYRLGQCAGASEAGRGTCAATTVSMATQVSTYNVQWAYKK